MILQIHTYRGIIMPTVLVTGGNGYIGSHTVISLFENNYDVVIADNLANSKMEVQNRLEKITGKRFKFYNVDCCDIEALRKVFEENKIDSVIHFAGLKAVGESVRKPLEYYSNNINSMLSVCKLMTEYDVNNPKLTSRTTVKVSPDNVVTVMKGGTERHSLILEKGVRHKCEYITSFGIISLGVFTDTVNVDLNDKGGEIKVHYNIDVQSELASSNELIINIKEANKDVSSSSDSTTA